MADDVKSMTAEFARDPGSLVFLQLAEALRARGQFDAAGKVVQAGLERHPDSVEARDLYARLLADAGDLVGAEREWNAVLASEPRHLGARKGLGFLCYRRGDLDAALDHLELALSADPTDPSVVQALQTVRTAADAAETPEPTLEMPSVEAPVAEAPVRAGRATTAVFAGLDDAEAGLLLVDQRGLVLGGGLRAPDGAEVADQVAAQLAGVSQEAERTARLLELGEWAWIVAEGAAGNMFLSPTSPAAVLLVVRDHSVPAGRLAVLAEKAATTARRWLEGQAL